MEEPKEFVNTDYFYTAMNKPEKKIQIFKTFAEQEEWHLQQMKSSTPQERFRSLLQMQQLTKAFHKPCTEKKVIIHHGYTGS